MSMSDWHLIEDAPPLCACDQCGRKSWDAESIDRVCGMTQPSGVRCVGWMISLGRATPPTNKAAPIVGKDNGGGTIGKDRL